MMRAKGGWGLLQMARFVWVVDKQGISHLGHSVPIVHTHDGFFSLYSHPQDALNTPLATVIGLSEGLGH